MTDGFLLCYSGEYPKRDIYLHVSKNMEPYEKANLLSFSIGYSEENKQKFTNVLVLGGDDSLRDLIISLSKIEFRGKLPSSARVAGCLEYLELMRKEDRDTLCMGRMFDSFERNIRNVLEREKREYIRMVCCRKDYEDEKRERDTKKRLKETEKNLVLEKMRNMNDFQRSLSEEIKRMVEAKEKGVLWVVFKEGKYGKSDLLKFLKYTYDALFIKGGNNMKRIYEKFLKKKGYPTLLILDTNFREENYLEVGDFISDASMESICLVTTDRFMSFRGIKKISIYEVVRRPLPVLMSLVDPCKQIEIGETIDRKRTEISFRVRGGPSSLNALRIMDALTYRDKIKADMRYAVADLINILELADERDLKHIAILLSKTDEKIRKDIYKIAEGENIFSLKSE